ncbi:hypothetical protein [Pseudomonas putida]|uniref:hypothetical protein n=1 Tax=Pseudomonas putida TaxID=303 RepID=UPI0009825122|nr:hypothetical protein [Pseudomonas putida]OMQ41084.1 hypothetical protein BKX96_04650 [Pseudomonas putida]
MIYVQLDSNDKVVAMFSAPQDPEYWPGIVEVEEDDPRYKAFLNPPRDLLADQLVALQSRTQLSMAQKLALGDRVGTLNDAIELEIATPAEEAELVTRSLQLKMWKTYGVLLGRVTSHEGWPALVEWPLQPADGIDLANSEFVPN